MNIQSFGAAKDDGRATTSSGAAREWLPRWPIIVVGGALAVSGTSSAEPNRAWEAPYVHERDATASGGCWVEPADKSAEQRSEATRAAVSELRRISGLTWEQLGELFDVSRRSVHFWASGKPLNAENERRLLHVLDVVRAADRGAARVTRSALLEIRDGMSAFDLLVEERFDEARATLGVGPLRARPVLGKLSAEAKAARSPLPLEELVDAQHDRVHRDPGHARAARTVRNSRRGTT